MPSTSRFIVRSMQPADVAAAFAVQQVAYVPEMVEPASLIAERLASAPDCAWVAVDEADGSNVGAYLMTYPSLCGKISALGSGFDVAAKPDALYLHDLAVAPRLSGRGVAGALVAAALDWASGQGLHYACLVSVQDTLRFWQRQGFEPVAQLNEQQQAMLATYSGPAYYCIKALRVD